MQLIFAQLSLKDEVIDANCCKKIGRCDKIEEAKRKERKVKKEPILPK